MMSEPNSYKRFLLFLSGIVVLILGIMLILTWWHDVVILFRGAIGMILSLAGMLILYILSQQK
ncbi:MAG TPA: hypothetical protein PLH56_04505 [Candidatus Omnitrophota bacterium]|nr:hypothetical protein [Candidatus Omnitrophota bacterium]